MTIHRASFLIAEPRGAVATGAATNDSLATASETQYKDLWQKAIDHKLVEWGRDPAQLEEFELIPPTFAAINRAVEIAMELRDASAPAPQRLIPDGDGGVLIERSNDGMSESFEIDRTGRVEYVRCTAGRVVERTVL